MSVLNVSLNFVACTPVEDEPQPQDAQVVAPDVIADGAGGAGGSPVDMGATGADGSGGTPPPVDQGTGGIPTNLDSGVGGADMSFVNPADARSVDAINSPVDMAAGDAVVADAAVPDQGVLPPPAAETHLAVTTSSFAQGSNAVTKFYNLAEGRFEPVPDVVTHQDTALSACGDDVFVVSRGDGQVLAYNKSDLNQSRWLLQFSPISNPQFVACQGGTAFISFYNPDPMEAAMIGRRDIVAVDQVTGVIQGGLDLSVRTDVGIHPRASAIVEGAAGVYVGLQHQNDNFLPTRNGTLENIVNLGFGIDLEGTNPVRAVRMDNEGNEIVVANSGNFADDAGSIEIVDPQAQTSVSIEADAFGAFAPGNVAVSGASIFVSYGFPTVVSRLPHDLSNGGEVVFQSGDFATDMTVVHTAGGDRLFITERSMLSPAVKEIPLGEGDPQTLVNTDPAPSALVGF